MTANSMSKQNEEQGLLPDSPMTNRMSRRELLSLGGAAIGSSLITGPASLAVAKAPMLGAYEPGYYRFKLGDFEITTVSDGETVIDKVFPLFGGNSTEEEVIKVLTENHAPPKRFNPVFRPTVINTGSELVLIDTGNGDDGFVKRPHAGNLVKQLAVAGYKPEQIDIVVVSHGHSDHIGGIKEAGKEVFPNATYVISEIEFDFWNKKAPSISGLAGFTKVYNANINGLKEKFRVIKPGDEVVPGIQAFASYGHTPGHLSFHVENNGQRIFIMNDCANHPVASFANPDWHFVFDIDMEQGAKTRRKVFDMCARDQLHVIAFHMPYPSIGRIVKKDATGYRWITDSI